MNEFGVGSAAGLELELEFEMEFEGMMEGRELTLPPTSGTICGDSLLLTAWACE